MLLISRPSKLSANVRRKLMSERSIAKDLWHDLMLLVKTPKPQPSLLARSIQFSTMANWMERLVAYRQLDNWLSNKHTNHENT